MAASFYEKQTNQSIYVNTQSNLIDAKTLTLHATSPAGVKKTFNLTLEEPASGIVRYNVASTSDFDEAGLWSFYVSVVYNSDRINRSEPFKILFNGV